MNLLSINTYTFAKFAYRQKKEILGTRLIYLLKKFPQKPTEQENTNRTYHLFIMGAIIKFVKTKKYQFETQLGISMLEPFEQAIFHFSWLFALYVITQFGMLMYSLASSAF